MGPAGWTHGDFHDLNLLFDEAGAVCGVLDWDRVGLRPWAAEVVRAGTLMFGFGDGRGLDLERVGWFAAGFRSVLPLPAGSVADAVGRLWWERVCDGWQLKRHYDQADTSCDHLFVSASALLAWWTEHRHAVTAAFTS